jgi:hypothetical protein
LPNYYDIYLPTLLTLLDYYGTYVPTYYLLLTDYDTNLLPISTYLNTILGT